MGEKFEKAGQGYGYEYGFLPRRMTMGYISGQVEEFYLTSAFKVDPAVADNKEVCDTPKTEKSMRARQQHTRVCPAVCVYIKYTPS